MPASSQSPDRSLLAARVAVSVVFLVDGAALGGWIPHIVTIKDSLNLTKTVLGMALLASGLGAITTMPFAGGLIHRFGSRRMSLMAGLLLCATIPCLLLAPSLPLFVAVLYVVGASNGQLDVAMNAHSLAVQKRFGRPILSGVHGWFSVGGFAGGAGAALAARLSAAPLVHMVLASTILAIALVVACRYLLPNSVDADAEGPRFVPPKGILLFLGVLAICSFVVEGGVWDWAAIYMREALHSSGVGQALAFGLFCFGMAIGRLSGDRFVHRMGSRRVLQISGVCAAGGLFLALLATEPVLAIAGFTLVGIGTANMVPLLFAAAGSQPGISAGTGIAAVTTCGYSGFLMGPPAIGLVSDKVSLAFALGLLGALAVAVAVFGPRAVRNTDRMPIADEGPVEIR